MADHGGRAARWAVALIGVAASAILVTAGGVLPQPPPGVAPAAAGSSTPSGAAAGSSTGPQPQDPEPTAGAAIVTRSGPAIPTQGTLPGVTSFAPFVSFIGDSWTDGAGATDGIGYAYLTARDLGWAHRVLGVGGSGYVRGGAGNVPFGERVLPAVIGNPDVVVIQGSINERSTPGAELTAAATDVLGRLQAAAGSDPAVLVLGASYVPGVPVAYVDKVNDSVRTAAGRLGLPFVDVAAENWTDPADRGIWADPYHPNDRGYQLIADRLAPLLQAVVTG